MNLSIRIVLTCIVVFLFQHVFFPGLLEPFFALNVAYVWMMPWQLLTVIFLHGSVGHLLFNMITLGLFGSVLEQIIGKRKFLYIFFGTGLIASLAFVLTGYILPGYQIAVGASGAIFGVMGVLTMLRPKMLIYVYFIPMRLWLAAILFIILDVTGVFYDSGVANTAHLGGMIAGLIIGYLFRKKFGVRRVRYRPVTVDEAMVDNWEEKYMKQ